MVLLLVLLVVLVKEDVFAAVEPGGTVYAAD